MNGRYIGMFPVFNDMAILKRFPKTTVRGSAITSDDSFNTIGVSLSGFCAFLGLSFLSSLSVVMLM